MNRGAFTGLCPLCGARTTGAYCHAHSWAAGMEPNSRATQSRARVPVGSGRMEPFNRRTHLKALVDETLRSKATR